MKCVLYLYRFYSMIVCCQIVSLHMYRQQGLQCSISFCGLLVDARVDTLIAGQQFGPGVLEFHR